MADEKKTSIFREKNVQAIASPEAMNDYLKVTSPGVWLFLGAVALLLAGVILWGIFGSIDTSVQTAVSSVDGKAVCVVPYNAVEAVMKAGKVSVSHEEDTREYTLGTEVTVLGTVTENTSPTLRIAGDFAIGEVLVAVEITDSVPEGDFTGTVVTERLKPISLLLQ